MSKKTKATIAITLAIAVMVLILLVQVCPYKDQSLVSTIQKGLPMQPFQELLSKSNLNMQDKPSVFLLWDMRSLSNFYS